jgi:hypothetical protein
MWVPADQTWLERVREHAEIMREMRAQLVAAQDRAWLWRQATITASVLACWWFAVLVVVCVAGLP